MWEFSKVADLLNKKQDIQQEIRGIQKKCQHPTRTLKAIRERVDSASTVIRWVCNECLLPIGYPNNKEITEFLK